VLSVLYQGEGDSAAARAELVAAVNLQPHNYESWLQLGLYHLGRHQPRLALPALERAYTLNPTVFATLNSLSQARAELSGQSG
jgi:cytochrome c-type biogenesis protein CcmH/NrfG